MHAPADRLSDLVCDWEEAQESGAAVSPETLCADCPELIEPLKARIAALMSLEKAIGLPPQETPDLPGYEWLGEIGAGGMGIVFQARQIALDRIVAVKTIRARGWTSALEMARLRAEAEALGRLQHPNVVQVYDVLERGQRLYLVLEYVGGGSLADAARGRLTHSPREAARIIQTVAEAVEVVHRQGLLHRDLKPANVLLDDAGNVKVSDFGLARPISRDSQQTLAGHALGSPSYMAPEQARGELTAISPRTDVYGLGATLYELLTGRPPHVGADMLETIQQVTRQEVVPPRLLVPSIPRDLESICLKALEKDPQRRYASAQALADDLGRLLAGKSVVARPISSLTRGWRWCRQHQVQASLAALCLLLLLAVVGGAAWYGARLSNAHEALASAQREKTLVEQKLDAEAANARSQQLLALTSQITARSANRRTGWLWKNREALAQAGPLATPPSVRAALRSEAARCFTSHDVRLVATLAQGFDAYCCAYHPRGRLLAVGGNYAMDGKEVEIRLYDPETQRLVQTVAFDEDLEYEARAHRPDGVRSLLFAEDGNTLYVGSRAGAVHVFDLSTGKRTRAWQAHDDWVTALRLEETGALVTASYDRRIRRWRLADGECLAEYRHTEMLDGLARLDNKYLLASVPPMVLHEQSLAPHDMQLLADDRVRSIREHPDGQSCYVACGRDIHLHAGGRSQRLAHLRDHRSPASHAQWVRSLDVDPTGAWLLSCDEVAARLWDTASGALVADIPCVAVLRSGAFSPQQDRFFLATDAGVQVYEVFTHPAWRTVAPSSQEIDQIAFSRQGVELATASYSPLSPRGTTLTLQSLASKAPGAAVFLDGAQCTGLAYSPDARQLAATTMDSDAVWTVEQTSGKLTHLSKSREPKLPLYLKDGKTILFCERGAPTVVSDGRSGPFGLVTIAQDGSQTPLWTNAHSKASTGKSSLFCVACAHDALAVSSHDGLIRLIDLGAGQERWSLADVPALVDALAFTNDGSRIVAGSHAGELFVIDARRGRVIARQEGHADRVSAAAIGRDGLILTGGRDQALRLWRLENDRLEPLLRIEPLSGPVKHIAFTDDGRRCAILMAHERGVRLLDLEALQQALQPLQLAW